jgi:Skp family chaperone for outer membrane proteins
MRSKTVLIALLTTLTGSVSLASAQGTTQVKIAYVNVQRLLQEAPQAQAASQALEGEFANRRRDSRT